MMRSCCTTLLALAGLTLAARAAAVDCTSAPASHSDQAVCASPALAKQDANLQRLLVTRAPSDALASSQADWEKSRARCNGNQACLDNAYRSRLAAVQAFPPKAEPPLRKPKIVISEILPDGKLVPIPPVAKAAPKPKVDATPMPGDGRSADERLASAAGPTTVAESTNDGWIVAALARSGIVILLLLGLAYGLRQFFGRCPSCRRWNRSRVIRVVADRTLGHQRAGRNEGRDASRHRNTLPVQKPLIVSKRVYMCGECNTRWEPGIKVPALAGESADFRPRP
ncbi:hypothetical protein [Pinirhizobacter soli]|uniref:hypothetical protein n=1 Tax=Pinirhizobacter soli TaxID=2786953 RepID=UPI002029B5F0|nr:hypothetical protein [Pinirhizobacter soli]